MATTTRILDANVNGTVYTANANDALEALDTCHSGATAPTDEVANGKLWLDTSTTPGILKIYNNATWEVVVNTTNVTTAGALMDSELTSIASVKALNQGVSTTDSPSFAGITSTGAFTSLGINDNAAATAVTIDANGKVGIGTSPSELLHIKNTTADANLQVEAVGAGLDARLSLYGNSTGVSQIRFGDEASTNVGLLTYDHTADTMAFRANSITAMTISSSGTLGVGTTTANGIINADHSVGSAVYTAYFTAHPSNGVNVAMRAKLNIGTAIRFLSPTGTDVGSIDNTTTSTSYTTTSDYRLKENIAPVQGAADIVKAMRPITYNFKADSTDWHDGFLAHELQELHPRAVTGEKDAVDEEGNPDYQGVDYSKLTPILTAALQEALNKIEVLEARVAALEP